MSAIDGAYTEIHKEKYVAISGKYFWQESNLQFQTLSRSRSRKERSHA